MRQFRVKYAALSVSAINRAGELMCFQLCDADYARAASAQAEQLILVADPSKLGRDAVVRACGAGQVDLLVTDAAPEAELLQELAAAAVTVVVAADAAAGAAAPAVD